MYACDTYIALSLLPLNYQLVDVIWCVIFYHPKKIEMVMPNFSAFLEKGF